MEPIRDVLARHGVRATPPRERVYASLCACCTHPTAEELHEMVGSLPGGRRLSLATVYNSLEVFTASGLCRRLPCAGGAGPSRYDADTSAHVHVVMPDGRIVDAPEPISREVAEALSGDVLDEAGSALGVPIDAVQIQLISRRKVRQAAGRAEADGQLWSALFVSPLA